MGGLGAFESQELRSKATKGKGEEGGERPPLSAKRENLPRTEVRDIFSHHIRYKAPVLGKVNIYVTLTILFYFFPFIIEEKGADGRRKNFVAV